MPFKKIHSSLIKEVEAAVHSVAVKVERLAEIVMHFFYLLYTFNKNCCVTYPSYRHPGITIEPELVLQIMGLLIKHLIATIAASISGCFQSPYSNILPVYDPQQNKKYNRLNNYKDPDVYFFIGHVQPGC